MQPSQPIIGKTARQAGAFFRPCKRYSSARAAFKSLLAALDLQPQERVLLPAYVGWSANEGSGVFDPIAQLGIGYEFYRVDGRLRIDLESLERCLAAGYVRVLVLIHYFGYVDPHYRDAVDLARRHDVFVVEDEAHALFTDYVGGACGRLGDAGIFSLHKMLPMPGGMLAVAGRHADVLSRMQGGNDDAAWPCDFDLLEISRRRRRNAQHLAELLAPLAEHIELLRIPGDAGEVPQTLPVIVRQTSRDALHFGLNEAGFGAVSLYHTLIPQVSQGCFPDAHSVSHTILNFPIHQEVEAHQLDDMAATLGQLLRQSRIWQPYIAYSHRSAA